MVVQTVSNGACVQNSGCGPNEASDDKALIGFAQLSITDEGKSS